MNERYHYDSREHRQPLNRQRRFIIFLFVLFTVSLSLNLAYVYTNEWNTGDDAFSLWQAVIIIFAICASFFLVAMLVSKYAKIGYASYQLLEVDDQGISWLLRKGKGKQSISFSDIEQAMTDPRHLILKRKDGEEFWLENYLIDDRETEWEQFMAAVRARVAVK